MPTISQKRLDEMRQNIQRQKSALARKRRSMAFNKPKPDPIVIGGAFAASAGLNEVSPEWKNVQPYVAAATLMLGVVPTGIGSKAQNLLFNAGAGVGGHWVLAKAYQQMREKGR